MTQEDSIKIAKAIVGYKMVHGCTLDEAKIAIRATIAARAKARAAIQRAEGEV